LGPSGCAEDPGYALRHLIDCSVERRIDAVGQRRAPKVDRHHLVVGTPPMLNIDIDKS